MFDSKRFYCTKKAEKTKWPKCKLKQEVEKPKVVEEKPKTVKTEMKAIEFNPETGKVKTVTKKFPSEIQDDEILVEVCYAGVCSIDLNIIDGNFPLKNNKPIVLGHEISGTVAKIGKDVTHVKIGDEIVVDPQRSCMFCDECRSGKPHFCKTGGLNTILGIGCDGGWSEFCVVKHNTVYKIPTSLTLEQAWLSEPMSCITHFWDKMKAINIGEEILILGSGIIGMLFASVLHYQGHREVTICDNNKDRLKLVEYLETCFDLNTPEEIKEHFVLCGNIGYDVIIDCSGNAKAIEQNFVYLKKGGRLIVFGVENPGPMMNIHPYQLFSKEITILGVLLNPFSFPDALNLLEHMADRYICLEKLGVQIFKLDEHEKAFESVRKGAITKATFKIKQ